MQRVDLVVEGEREVVADRLLPGGGAAGGAAAVGDDHREALVGEPLRGEVRVVRGQHPGPVRTAVGVHEDGEGSDTVVVSRHKQGA